MGTQHLKAERSLSPATLKRMSASPEANVNTNTDSQSDPKVYKRRWFGLVQLALLNLILAFNSLNYVAVPDFSAEFFGIDLSAINLLTTGFLIGFVIASPFSVWILGRGPRLGMLIASVLIFLGNWIRYAGTRGRRFSVVAVGQMLISLAQPIILAAPTRYSELWFRERGRVPATAATSLSMLLGTAIAQLLTPALVKDASALPRMILQTAVASTIIVIPTVFVSNKPPTPASTKQLDRPTFRVSLRLLARNRYFWIAFFTQAMLMGVFSAFSSLLTQMMLPYGFSDRQAGVGGALLVLVGLVVAAVATPLIGRYHIQLITIKISVPIVGICFAVFYWAPLAKSPAAAYLILSFLGASSLVLLPVMLEYLTEITTPVNPEVSSLLVWTTSQVLGAIFLVIMSALKDQTGKFGPQGNLQRALIFQAVMSCTVIPLAFLLKESSVRDIT